MLKKEIDEEEKEERKGRRGKRGRKEEKKKQKKKEEEGYQLANFISLNPVVVLGCTSHPRLFHQRISLSQLPNLL